VILLDGIHQTDLHIRSGEVFGVFGRSGAGKSSSSDSSTLGWLASARAMPTRCFHLGLARPAHPATMQPASTLATARPYQHGEEPHVRQLEV
jgi:ABC-type branched-subunit amino acid transport system ATPase component